MTRRLETFDSYGLEAANHKDAGQDQGDAGEAAGADRMLRLPEGAEMVEQQADEKLSGDHQGDGQGDAEARHPHAAATTKIAP